MIVEFKERAERRMLRSAGQFVIKRGQRFLHQGETGLVSREWIQEELEISQSHLTPELPLHLLTPACPLYHRPATEQDLPDPWWSVYWPGGQVLARTVLDNPHLVRSRRVLDLGSGCGALAIAAVRSGAQAVTANDIDQNAFTATKINMKLNNIQEDKIDFLADNLLETQQLDILENVDTLLIGDMFYDEQIGSSVLEICQKFVNMAGEKEVLLGDPGRWYLESSAELITSLFTCISKHSLPPATKRENYGFDTGFAWKMK